MRCKHVHFTNIISSTLDRVSGAPAERFSGWVKVLSIVQGGSKLKDRLVKIENFSRLYCLRKFTEPRGQVTLLDIACGRPCRVCCSFFPAVSGWLRDLFYLHESVTYGEDSLWRYQFIRNYACNSVVHRHNTNSCRRI